jgi:hypothetical protein
MVINVGNMADMNEESASFESRVHTKGFVTLQSYEELPTILVSFGRGKEVTHLGNHTRTRPTH